MLNNSEVEGGSWGSLDGYLKIKSEFEGWKYFASVEASRKLFFLTVINKKLFKNRVYFKQTF